MWHFQLRLTTVTALHLRVLEFCTFLIEESAGKETWFDVEASHTVEPVGAPEHGRG